MQNLEMTKRSCKESQLEDKIAVIGASEARLKPTQQQPCQTMTGIELLLIYVLS